ncbi:unnamed protein product [Phytomonas sp. Hart1]|nr:unnamed protein product [Phytomonas sp. Hart1]|eukprot:CCW71477.1 unnamed protein product [Phytomonas sp. isolate Hart1]
MTNINTNDTNKITSKGNALATLTFFIDGMSCTSCVMLICNALKENGNGIHEAKIEFSDHRAEVTMEKGKEETSTHQTALAMLQIVKNLGYSVRDATLFDSQLGKRSFVNLNSLHDGEPYSYHEAVQSGKKEKEHANTKCEPFFEPPTVSHASSPKPHNSQVVKETETILINTFLCETRILIEGMSCASCAARIESRLLKTPGVEKASVNFTMLSASILHAPAELPLEALLRVIRDLGYSPKVLHSDAVKGATTVPNSMPSNPLYKNNPNDIHSDQKNNKGDSSTTGFSSSFDNAQKPQFRLLIEGMSCASCATRVEHALAELPFVVGCHVVFTTGIAAITTRPNELSPADHGVQLIQEVRRLGYEACLLSSPAVVDPSEKPSLTTRMDLEEGESELVRTRQALERTTEIRHQRRLFLWSAVLALPLVLIMVLMATTDFLMHHSTYALLSETLQLCCTTPIVCYFGRQFFRGAWHGLRVGAFTMDTLVAIGVGTAYGYSLVVYGLRVGGVATLTSYFEAAGLLTTFMLLGRYLEARAKRGTSGALIELLSLVPRETLVVNTEGVAIAMASSAVRPGMRVRVLAGERVPVDGVVLEGCSDVDEQLLTGESLPVSVGPGRGVIGGTLNLTAVFEMQAERVGAATTLGGILRVVEAAQASRPPVQRVADRLAGVFVPAVLIIAGLTLVVWMTLGAARAYPARWCANEGWVGFAFNFFIATVVSACPCALGLATPTAILVGTGVGARMGVLVKSGAALENVRGTSCVLLDKTGTITTEKLEVVQVKSFLGPDAINPLDFATFTTHHIVGGNAEDMATTPLTTIPTTDEMVRRLVAAVEELSTHPIARAVVEALGPSNAPPPATVMKVQSSITHPGKGVEATISTTRSEIADDKDEPLEKGQHHVVVSNLTLMNELNVAVGKDVVEEVHRRGERGYTTVVAAVDGVCRLVISLSNEPKLEARGVVHALQQKGLRVMMITGDNVEVARRVGEEVGIAPEDICAGALPATKAKIVQQIQCGENKRGGEGKKGKGKRVKVMFVGDGINDSPALAQADVGVALGAGTDVAIEAADAVLMRNALSDIINLQAISVITVRRIYANFVWAFGYNLIMLPLASGVVYPFIHLQVPPVVAGLAMVFSSLTVLLSSLSIRFFRPVKRENFL